MFASGSFLTTAKLNKILENLLGDICGQTNSKISCHSFRAGIPTTIINFNKKFVVDDVKNFGRWRENSYKRYTKLEKNSRKQLYEKIYSVLNSIYE